MTAPEGRYGDVILTHSYGGYTRGCRCDICRAAKAAYSRARRAVANAPTRTPAINAKGRPILIAEGIRHGTRHGYEEYACRCDACRTAHNRSDKRVKR